MSRPSQLLLVGLVYALGTVIGVAHGAPLDRPELGVGLVALVPVAASIHYANEYADYWTDVLTVRTPFSGGSGALPRTGLSRDLARRAAWASLVVGLAFAVACLVHGFPVAALGVLVVGAIFGWQYSVGPLALARRGLGEVDNAALGGLALPLYGYAVQAGRVTGEAFLACLPFAILVFLNLLDTTWPDRRADAAVGKDTLATRWSPRRLRAVYAVGAGLWLVSIAVLRGPVLPSTVALPSLLVTPLVAWGALAYTRTRSPFPTVAAMVLFAGIQVVAWATIAGLV